MDKMTAAAAVYAKAGFVEIEADRHNPLRTARFYEAKLGETDARPGTWGPSAPRDDHPETPH